MKIIQNDQPNLSRIGQGDNLPNNFIPYLEEIKTGQFRIPKSVECILGCRIRTKTQYLEAILQHWVGSEMRRVYEQAQFSLNSNTRK